MGKAIIAIVTIAQAACCRKWKVAMEQRKHTKS